MTWGIYTLLNMYLADNLEHKKCNFLHDTFIRWKYILDMVSQTQGKFNVYS